MCLEKCNQGFHRFLVNVEGRNEWNVVRCICHDSCNKNGAKGYKRKDISQSKNFVSFEGVGVVDYIKQH